MEINGSSNVVFKDYPIDKKITNNGELKIYEDSDALTQALKIWLVSDKGEKIRSRTGGVLAPFLNREIDDDTAKEMKTHIMNTLKKEFTPPIEIVYLDVKGDKNKNQWIIAIAGYNSDLAVGVNTNVIITKN